MKRIFNVAFVLLVVFSLGLCSSVNVNAASKSSKAKLAYKKLLSTHKARYMTEEQLWNVHNKDKNKNYDGFFIKDINGDKVPELFTLTIVGARYEVIRIFTYQSGKVKQVKKLDNYHWANGAFNTYICKKNHIHNCYGGYYGSNSDIYKLKKNNKIATVKSCDSKKKYDLYTGMKDNTKANRKKIK